MKRIWKVIHSIKFIYIMLVTVAVLTVTFAGNFINNKLSDEAYATAGNYAIGNLNSVSVNIDEIMQNVEFVFTPLISNPQFVDLAQNIRFVNQVSTYDDFEERAQFTDIFFKSYISNNYIDSIYFFNSDNNIAFSATDNLEKLSDVSIPNTNWYINHINLPNQSEWSVSKAFLSSDEILSIYRDIKSQDKSRNIGVLSININSSTICKILSTINWRAKGYAFVVDSLGNIVVSTPNAQSSDVLHQAVSAVVGKGAEGNFETKLSGRNVMIAYHSSGYSGLEYIAVLPMDEINAFAPIVMKYLLAIYLALIGVFALIAVVTYTYFYRPVNRLFAGMRRLEAGDFSVRLNSGRLDEFGYIYENFNNMVKNLKQLIDENYIIQLHKKDAQLKIVLSQINEHLLFNTLDCIHWLARKNNVREISDIIFSLSKFYSLSLSGGRDVIKVSEIVSIIDSYMNIQQIRKPGSFEYRCSVDEPLAECLALKYLFQPIVENAVMHGIQYEGPGASISVTFQQNGETMRFEVSDNGIGISEGRMLEIRQSLAGDDLAQGTAFALSNINTQIKLFYGEQYGLCIESVPGEGTRVWFDIPVIRQGDSNA